MNADRQRQSTSTGEDKLNISDSNIINTGKQIIGNNNTYSKIKNITYVNVSANKLNENGTLNITDINKCPVDLPYHNSFWGPTKNYHGREDELKQIHRMFEVSSTSVLAQVITGLGGVGKTECAKRYAEVYDDQYNIIIFVVAEVPEFLDNEMYEIADHFQIKIKTGVGSNKELLPIRKIMNEMYRSFSRWGIKTLFVFDNAESPALFSADYLPMRLKELKGNVHILITSRWQEWNVGDLGIVETFRLNVFSTEEAREYVKKSLENDNYFTDKDIYQLIDIVQCFPLALNQAVSYILERNKEQEHTGNKFTLVKYLKLFEEKKDKLLASGQSDKSMYKLTVRTTWNVTMENLKKAHGKCGKQAIKILKIIAFLSPDKIPFKKLLGIDKHISNAINLLKNFSLIVVDGDYLNIHRLLQEVVKLDIKNIEKYIKKTLYVLSKDERIYFQQQIDEHLYEALKTVVDHESIYNQLYKQYARTPLVLVTQREDCDLSIVVKIIERELKYQNFFDFFDSFKNSVKNRNIVIAKYLYKVLETNFDIDKEVMLKIAFENHSNNEELILFILNDLKSKINDCNPLVWIDLEDEQFEKIWPMIKMFNWNYNLKDDDGNTILMNICKSGKTNLIKTMLETGECNLDLKNKCNQNILHFAVMSQTEDTVRLVMKYLPKEHFNDQDDMGNSPFMTATLHDMTAIVKLMLESREIIDFDLKNK